VQGKHRCLYLLLLKEMWDEGDEIKNIHQYFTAFHHNNLEKQG
jgi:hypothetical protein